MHKIKREYVIICMAVLGVLLVAMWMCPPHYSMNDDAMMKSILSGVYTGVPDGHAVYMKYPLTGILSLLYRITDKVSWFDMFMAGCFVAAVSAVIIRVYGVLKAETGEGKGSIAPVLSTVCALCFALFLPQIFTMHYTLVAAMVGSCGCFLFMTGGGTVAVVLLIICYCIRSQVFLMLLPFLLVAVLWRILERKGERLLKQLLVLTVGVVVCMAWNSVMYRGGEWQYYQAYNDSRTGLYDYDVLLPYEENRESFEEAGISAMQHRLLEEYALVLAEDITPEMMDAAADITASRKHAAYPGAEYLLYCIREYYYHIRYNGQPYNYIFIGGCILCIALLVLRKQWWKLGLMGCFLAGRSLIWLVLIWQGRFPERVYLSLYFGEIMLLAGMIFSCVRQRKRGLMVFGLTAAALLTVAGVIFSAETWDRNVRQAESHREWSVLTEYCQSNPDTAYLLDIYSTVKYSGKVWEAGARKENFLLAGGWLSASPLAEGRLEEIESGNCCYVIGVGRDTDWLYDFCREYPGGLRLEKTDSISLDGTVLFDVYRFGVE